MNENLFILLASLAVISSVPLAAWALQGDRGSVAGRITDATSPRANSLRESALERSLLERIIAPFVRFVGYRMMRFTPGGWLNNKAALLNRAGWGERFTAEQLIGVKVSLPIVVAIIAGLRISAGATSTWSLVLSAAAVAAAFVVPDMLVRNQAERRGEQLINLLPDMLDQLTISVEAGQGFDAALTRIVQNEDNELTREFARMLRDVRLGTPRHIALQAIADRAQVDDLNTVVLSLRQSTALGVSMGRALRSLSAEMREKRRFRAEEKARQLPVKLIFPLALFIMPALFIVMLGPAIMKFSGVF